MYLIPLIRINRAVASTLILPNEPLKAIAVSEIISIFSPIINPFMYKKILTLTISLMYMPNYSYFILNNYKKKNLKYNQPEICFLLLFNLYLLIN